MEFSQFLGFFLFETEKLSNFLFEQRFWDIRFFLKSSRSLHFSFDVLCETYTVSTCETEDRGSLWWSKEDLEILYTCLSFVNHSQRGTTYLNWKHQAVFSHSKRKGKQSQVATHLYVHPGLFECNRTGKTNYCRRLTNVVDRFLFTIIIE